MREKEEHTVITITTDSQMMDSEEPTHREENPPKTGETADTNEVTKIPAAPPSATSSRTLTEQTPLPTSPNGCSTAHSVRTNNRYPTATPTRSSHDTTGSPEGGKVNDSGGGVGLTELRADVGENKTLQTSKKIVVILEDLGPRNI